MGVTTLGGLVGEALYFFAVSGGFIVANEPCGTYLNPNSCMMINPGYQLIFVVSGGTIGFMFYFVNVMHKSKFAFRMDLTLAMEGILLGALLIILPRYDRYFGETAYFAEMFIVSVFIALTGFLIIDRFRARTPAATPENLAIAGASSGSD
jgi:hypothetical protein